MKNNTNLRMVDFIAGALGDLADEVVFVGGAVISLYIDDPAAPKVRITDDVDCVIEVSTYGSFHDVEKSLTKKGFQPYAGPGTHIGRWVTGPMILDVIPTEPEILGFSNRWYKDGVKNKLVVELPSSRKIHIFSLPYFLGSKFGRLQVEGRASI